MTDVSLQALKFFIYCRKSSEQEDRQILSLPAQEKILLELAIKEKFHVVDIYLESKSAHKAGRPLFNKMLERIENGEGNALLVWDESRIARNSLDSGKVIYMIDLEQIKAIVKP
jgi:DNA invertase Pin-like site-specific DNA recombinase